MRMIFVNLPATDLQASGRFLAEPGLTFNPRLPGARAGCLVVDGNALVVLLAGERLRDFHQRGGQRRQEDGGGLDVPAGWLRTAGRGQCVRGREAVGAGHG